LASLFPVLLPKPFEIAFGATRHTMRANTMIWITPSAKATDIRHGGKINNYFDDGRHQPCNH
jgi:hypothetical protein